MHPFDYAKPNTLEEAGKLLKQAGGGGYVLAGGTILALNIAQGLVKPQLVVDIKGVPELSVVKFDQHKGLSIGARVTMNQVASHNDVRRQYPLFAEVCGNVGSYQVRNRATVAGSVCAALAASDVLPALLCYNAVCRIWTSQGIQEILVSDFITRGAIKELTHGQIVVSVDIPTPCANSHAVYHKLAHGRGGHATLAGAAVSACLIEDIYTEWRIALTGVAPYVFRADRAEEVLQGVKPGVEQIQQAVELATAAMAPEDDLQASAEYRQAMAAVFVRRGIEDVVARLSGDMR